YAFDEEVLDSFGSNDPDRIVRIDPELRKLAGECGYRSMLVAIGVSNKLPLSCDVISYEAPFGVGYLVAQMTNHAARCDDDIGEKELTANLLELARAAVERYVREGELLEAPLGLGGVLEERAPCFVSLKTLD